MLSFLRHPSRSGTPAFQHWNIFDFGVSEVNGELGLTMLDWHEQQGVILDKTYRVRKTVPMLADGDTFQNMHAFNVVEDGSRALVLTVRHTRTVEEVSPSGERVSRKCDAGFQGFRELDLQSPIATPVFRWDAQEHINLNDSTYLKYDKTIDTMCHRGWDLMHSNSIAKFPDGDYLLSARHTDALYKVSHVDGSILWRIGGVMSDFEMSNDARFTRQHDARVVEVNETHTLISLFDNAVGERFQPPSRVASRGLILSLDTEHMTGEVLTQYEHPKGWLTDGRGSFQLLPNGNAFIDWAKYSYISEHTPDGAVVMEASLKARVDTYRAFKFPWVGRPVQPPDVLAEIVWADDNATTNVFMSWNGATEVVRWNVSGTDIEGRPVHLGLVDRKGFETSLRHESMVFNVHAEALDRDGVVLGASGRVGNVGTLDAESSSSSSQGSMWRHGIVAGVVGILAGVILALGAFLTFRWWRSRRQKQLTSEKSKGEYQMVVQEEDR